MERIECSTQAECDAALKDGKFPILIGDGRFVINGAAYVEARGRSHVEAWGSSHVEARGRSHVEAWGSSHVVAWESSHVVAWESSHVEARESSHVVARGSSHVEARGRSHVEAWGSSHVVAWESSHVEASKQVAIHIHSKIAEVSGGVKIVVKAPTTAREWCDYYGAKIEGKLVTLYKAVDQNFKSSHGFAYLPGTSPEAPDWDGGEKECGGGLHFCSHPLAALYFFETATRFVACLVVLKDIVVHKNPNYPTKIKARRVAGAIYEVDRYGNRL